MKYIFFILMLFSCQKEPILNKDSVSIEIVNQLYFDNWYNEVTIKTDQDNFFLINKIDVHFTNNEYILYDKTTFKGIRTPEIIITAYPNSNKNGFIAYLKNSSFVNGNVQLNVMKNSQISLLYSGITTVKKMDKKDIHIDYID